MQMVFKSRRSSREGALLQQAGPSRSPAASTGCLLLCLELHDPRNWEGGRRQGNSFLPHTWH